MIRYICNISCIYRKEIIIYFFLYRSSNANCDGLLLSSFWCSKRGRKCVKFVSKKVRCIMYSLYDFFYIWYYIYLQTSKNLEPAFVWDVSAVNRVWIEEKEISINSLEANYLILRRKIPVLHFGFLVQNPIKKIM